MNSFRSTLLFFITILSACSNKFDGKNGVFEEFYSNGKVLKKSVEFKDGRIHGNYSEYYYNQKIKIEVTFEHGRQNGIRKKYYENGILKSEESIVKGRKDGWSKFYNKKGKLKSEVLYQNGVYNGLFNTYYDNGKLAKIYNYRFGKRDGEVKEFYENGQLKFITTYDNNEPGKGLKEYTMDGKEIDHNFTIQIKELNQLAFKNQYQYIIKLSNPQEGDRLYVSKEDDEFSPETCMQLPLEKDHFRKVYYVEHGGFVMDHFTLFAKRKTPMGNTLIISKPLNVSINNYY